MRRSWLWWIIPLSGVVVVGLAALAVVLPPLLVEGRLSSSDRAKEIGDLRTGLIAIVGGVAIAAGTVIGAMNLAETQRQNRLIAELNREQLELNRRGQVTERFSKAVEQLGQSGLDELDIRIGGVYAIEQIARDSPELHWPIVEILTAFVREHAKKDAAFVPDEEEPTPFDIRVASDIQAAVTVLGRRDSSGDRGRLNLSGANLPAVNLERANFQGVDLRDADLQGADGRGANLVEADLEGASLQGATLRQADLQRAVLTAADLQDANLRVANLRGAYLQEANLHSADLSEADLGGAHLFKASLENAGLQVANLQGAYLRDANLQGANLIGANLQEANLNNANLQKAVLNQAELQNANLRAANLQGAAFFHANLQGATLDLAEDSGMLST